MKVAIIGGTGVYDQSLLEQPRELVVDTRFGKALLQQGLPGRKSISGPAWRKSTGAPHQVNYGPI